MREVLLAALLLVLAACRSAPSRPDTAPDGGEVAGTSTLVGPPLDPSVPTQLATSSAFLYTGTNPVQTGVDAGTISPIRVAVIRGRVLDRQNQPLVGVTLTIKDHPELGQTLSRADGRFDLAVNGGGLLTVNYQKPGHLPVQRQANVPWQDYVLVDDVVMISRDPQVTEVAFGDEAAGQVARGTPQTDKDGTRQATVFFPPGTTAELYDADGGTWSASTLHLHLTEFTVGANGPGAMPGPLPPTSGYTYAVEMTADEVTTKVAGKDVVFNHPVYFYVENFLGFPAGAKVPVGYYDAEKSAWIPFPDGQIVTIVGIANGLAQLDIDGNAASDGGAAVAVSDAERAQLANLYTVGTSLERIPLSHFSIHDPNFSILAAAQPSPAPMNPKATTQPDPGCSSETSGSIIECERQVLGERVPLTGTPFSLNYRSSRVPGRTANRTLDIPLSGPTVSASLQAIVLDIHVAGREFHYTYPPAPNLSQIFIWDGLDAYGRALTGTWPVEVSIGYQYPAVYQRARGVIASFGLSSGEALQVEDGTVPARFLPYQRQTYRTWLKGNSPRPLGSAGWSLSVHHSYDPVGKTLLLGTGSQRSTPAISAGIARVLPGPLGDPNYGHRGMAVGQDGSIYYSQFTRIFRVTPEGVVTSFVGTGHGDYNGDNIPAVSANIDFPSGLALANDGSLFFADLWANRVRRVDPNGIITTVAGNGKDGYSGDGIPATSASLSNPTSVAIGADGSIYIVDSGTHRVRRVGPDGMINTVAGNGQRDFGSDGVPATLSAMFHPSTVQLAPDGSLYVSESGRIRRIGSDGLIATVAGCLSNTPGVCIWPSGRGDGLPATSARTEGGRGSNEIAFGHDGSIYMADGALRRIAPDGIISTIAQMSDGSLGDGLPLETTLFRCGVSNVTIGPDGSLSVFAGDTIRRVVPSLPEFSAGDLSLSSEDGNEIYQFDSAGRHLRTLNAITGSTIYSFGYNASRLLSTVTDANGDVTTLEYDQDGLPTAVVARFGQRTALSIDANHEIERITNPAGEAYAASYSADGLMTSFTDPRGNVSTMIYDGRGRLLVDSNAAGGSKTLARTELPNNSYEVRLTTGLSRTTTHRIEYPLIGGVIRTTTQPDGTQSVAIIAKDASHTATSADGTVVSSIDAADPRFGMQASYPESVRITAGGNTLTRKFSRSVTLSDPNNVLSLVNLTKTVTQNGRTSSSVYDAATKTVTLSSPTGRTAQYTLDAQGRVVQGQVSGLAVATASYDGHGRPLGVTQGAGADARAVGLSYNAQGLLRDVTDPLGRVTSFEYDLAGRPTKQTRPDGQSLQLSYDASGNVTSVTPAGSAAHGFTYTPVDEWQSYTPPVIPGTGTGVTSYTYNADKQVTRVLRPDGQAVDFVYDAAGRLSTTTSPTGVTTYGYSPDAGKLATVTAPDGVGLAYTYSGFLPETESWTGPVAGTVTRAYNNDFQLASLTVGGTPIAFGYDGDLLLTHAGGLTITRREDNGLVSGTTLGTVTTTQHYSAFGELSEASAAVGASALYAATYVRDKLGRITNKTETIQGSTTAFAYGYDLAGRLASVSVNGGGATEYQYDSNGNRTGIVRPIPLTSVTAIYDAQDRLTSSGDASYGYTANGELLTRTVGADVTRYEYDVAGNLRKVTLPGSSPTTVEYVVDGRNRRVGKKVNGALTEGFLYGGQLRPVAWVGPTGAIKATFVYGLQVNVPETMTAGGHTYRILTDHLGSPRLVVESLTGAVAQRIDYDAFGNVVTDSAPGFQPFGFAGGLWDRDTGLVRFGARDYDPRIGRWISKDSVGLGGGPNLYDYARADPVNFIDPRGKTPVAAGGAVGAEVGSILGPVGVLVGAIVGAAIAAYATYELIDYLSRPAEMARPRPGSKPKNCPSGTKPIDEMGMPKDDIHTIKDGVGAGPKDWTGITPDGDVITGDGNGEAVNNGPASDYLP